MKKPTSREVVYGHDVKVTEHLLDVTLSDGRIISVPTEWFPRLKNATDSQRSHWEWIGDHEGIHWPEIDEDIRVIDLIEGKRSAESSTSFSQWLENK